MKKSFEIRVEKAKKRDEEKARVEFLMRERPEEYLEQLYKERRDIYDSLDKIKKQEDEFLKRNSWGFSKWIKMMMEIGLIDEGKRKTKNGEKQKD